MVKKISHKEVRRRMKMNEMAEAQHWLERLWKNHRQKITWGAVGLGILVVVVYLYSDSRQKSQLQALTLFGEALASASTENYEEALPLADQIVQQFSSARIYPLALMLKGDILYAQNDVEGALECYQQVADSGDHPESAAAALLGMAACQESLNREGEAEGIYRRILQQYPNSAEVEDARFQLAQLLDRQGEAEAAIAYYRAIPEDSVWAVEAEQRADWLESAPLTLALPAAPRAKVADSTPS